MTPGEAGGQGDGPAGLLTWAKLGWVCLASGLLLLVTAGLTDSVFLWIDGSACMILAVVFFVVHLRTGAAQPELKLRGGPTPNRWRVNALLLIAFASVISPPAKTGIESFAPSAQSSQEPPRAAPAPSIFIFPGAGPRPYVCRNGHCRPFSGGRGRTKGRRGRPR